MTLEVKNVSLTLKGSPLFSGVNFLVKPGQSLTLMGDSGCGKSSLLGFISGTLDTCFTASGSLMMNGEDITQQPAFRRHIGLQFQEHLLFPHMTIGENLAFGIPAYYPKKTRQQMVITALEDCGLRGYANRSPQKLSGGQKARVDLMRTLLSEPKALLMDEPFSRLNQSLKQSFRSFIAGQIKKRSMMAIMVTHDEQDIFDRHCVYRL